MKFKTSPSGRIVQATPPTHADHRAASTPGDHTPLKPASPWNSAGESAVRATDSSAVHHDIGVLQHWDDVDENLEALGVSHQPMPIADPRILVAHASEMTNCELGDLLVRLSAEHDRVSRLRAKQDYILGGLRHVRRDCEIEIRRVTTNTTMKLDDVVWSDPRYRKYTEVLLLQERVHEELKADLVSLDRHHAAVSRLIETRRQEQERELIGLNVPNRRPASRLLAPR